jgi:hypothetical protein
MTTSDGPGLVEVPLFTGGRVTAGTILPMRAGRWPGPESYEQDLRLQATAYVDVLARRPGRRGHCC